jgi:calcineurin-like phosphoesterase family protein
MIMNLPGVYKIFLEKWDGLQTCWIISDTHFGDKDLSQEIHNHPSDEELVKIINAKCGKNDLLIHLGDVGDVEYVKLLRAKRKILICGNHDAGRTNYERQTFTKIFDKEYYTKDMAYHAVAGLYPGWRISIGEGFDFHSPFEYWKVTADNMLFDEVYEGPLMIAEKLILSHEPIPNLNWAMNIHGHIHNRHHKNDKYHFNVCCDAIGYLPINFNQWMKQGYLSNIEPLHRITIDKATKRSKGGRK